MLPPPKCSLGPEHLRLNKSLVPNWEEEGLCGLVWVVTTLTTGVLKITIYFSLQGVFTTLV